MKRFDETTYKQNFSKNQVEKQEFSNSPVTKTVTNKQSDVCENEIPETDLLDSIKSMKNNKTPGLEGLTKESYEIFWNKLKTPCMC